MVSPSPLLAPEFNFDKNDLRLYMYMYVCVCGGGVYVMWGDGVLFIFCKCVAIFSKLKYYSRTDLILYLHFMFVFFKLSFKAYLSLSQKEKKTFVFLSKKTEPN